MLLHRARHFSRLAFSTCTKKSLSQSKGQKYWSERILPALEVFRSLKKHCIVDQRFVVPAEEPWPKATHGLKLGSAVHNIRSGQYADHVRRDIDRLEKIGFSWNAYDSRWKEMILPSCEVYVKLHGSQRIPSGFVVPSHHPWPEEAWGIRLGYILRDIRSKGCYACQIKADADRLEELGLLEYLVKSKDDIAR